MNAAQLLSKARVVPVIEIDDVATAVPLAEALLESGLDVIEITLRTPAALAALESIAKQAPTMLVGAGSVRLPEHVGQVSDAGARFAVSPGSSTALLEAVERASLPFVPGAVTPSESLELLDRGYTLQKFFPAGLAGGSKYLAAISGPIPEVEFMPTGGIGIDNAGDYLALPNVRCVGGSWVVPRTKLAAGDYAGIAALAAEAANL